MKKTIQAKNGTYKYNLFLKYQFKLDHGIWYVKHNGEFQPFWTTPKTHKAHIYKLKQIMARSVSCL